MLRTSLVVLFAAAITTGVSSSSTSVRQAASSNLHVLSIGVEPSLLSKGKFDLYAQDARFVAEAFQRGNGLFARTTSTVVDGSKATRANVLTALSQLKTAVGENGLAVVFFSAHGGWSQESGYAISVAKRSTGGWDSIKDTELLDAVKAVKGRVVVLLDTCCAAGVMPSRASETPRVSFITACGREQSSYGQGDDAAKPHGYFVIALYEALNGMGDLNRDGIVDVREVQSYIRTRATALCSDQNAVARTPSELLSQPLAKIDPKRDPAPIYVYQGARNPFGLPDIQRPLGEEVTRYAAETLTPGSPNDENATHWNRKRIRGSAANIEGSWEYRWRNPGSTEWVLGTARIRIADGRVFILCRDTVGKYLIECRFGVNDRLIGRYVNLNDPSETTPIVLRNVGDGRMDGYWPGSRWDFRREPERSATDPIAR